MIALFALLAGVGILLYARAAQGSIAQPTARAEPDESWDFVGPLPMSATGGNLPAGGVVPRLVIALNAGQHPRIPPTDLYLDPRFRSRIDRVVREANAAATGLRLGLNSWWRPIGSVGEELSQHHIACALDVQGPDQEAFAGRLGAMGWTVLRQGNDGTPYKHIHAQLEVAGLLTRLGVKPSDLSHFA